MRLLDRILNDSQTNVEETPDEDPDENDDKDEFPKYSSRDIEKTKTFDIDTVRIHFQDGTSVTKEGHVQSDEGLLTVSTLKNFSIKSIYPHDGRFQYLNHDSKTVFDTDHDLIKYTEVIDSKELEVTASAKLNFKQESEDSSKKLNSITQEEVEKQMIDEEEGEE